METMTKARSHISLPQTTTMMTAVSTGPSRFVTDSDDEDPPRRRDILLFRNPFNIPPPPPPEQEEEEKEGRRKTEVETPVNNDRTVTEASETPRTSIPVRCTIIVDPFGSAVYKPTEDIQMPAADGDVSM